MSFSLATVGDEQFLEKGDMPPVDGVTTRYRRSCVTADSCMSLALSVPFTETVTRQVWNSDEVIELVYYESGDYQVLLDKTAYARGRYQFGTSSIGLEYGFAFDVKLGRCSGQDLCSLGSSLLEIEVDATSETQAYRLGMEVWLDSIPQLEIEDGSLTINEAFYDSYDQDYRGFMAGTISKKYLCLRDDVDSIFSVENESPEAMVQPGPTFRVLRNGELLGEKEACVEGECGLWDEALSIYIPSVSGTSGDARSAVRNTALCSALTLLLFFV